MSTPLDLKLDPEKVQEIPMVDLAFMVLKAANTPFYYRDLMNEVAKLRGLTEEQINDVIAQLYTEINIDGRFACVGGQNLWGLKRWYPVDRSEEAITGGTPRPRIINDDDDDDYADDDDSYHNDEEEDFDFVDEDSEEEEEIFEDEDSDVEDDVDIEEEIDEDDADLNEEEDRDEFEDEDEKEEDM